MKLIYLILLAALIGVLAGNLIDPHLIASLKPLGEVYIRLLKMIALPLIFFSILSGITSHSDSTLLYKIGLKSVFLFLITGVVAALIGIFSSFLLTSNQSSLLLINATQSQQAASLNLDSFINMIIPSSLITPFINDSTIQVTLLAIIIGITLFALPNKEKKFLKMIVGSSNTLFLKIIKKILYLSPLTVFIFIAYLTSHFEKKSFMMLIYFVATLFTAYLIQYIFLGFYIRFISKLPFLPFFIKSWKYQWIALSTGSSKASLPSTIEVATHSLGISKEKASFVLPLGASINMQGLAIYLVLSVLFVAKATSFVFSPTDYVLLALIAPLMAIGTAGIPGGALAILPVLFSIWNLPYEYIPLFIAIDPLINMFRSALNITGDVAVTLILDKLHGGLKIETYKKMEAS